MKHFYLFFCLLFCGLVNGQIINFPDANFKVKLMQPYVAVTNNPNDIYLDSNNDGELEVSEVDNVWQLDVSNANISDLTGIEYFTSLKYLNCNNNLLTTISILAPTALSMLYANHNALTSVSVNWDSFKEGLDLSYNNLTSYTIESGTYYETVNLSHNQLTSLVIDNATFEFFSVSHNNLTTIQVNGTTSAYSSADFRNNQFSLLDLSLFSFNNECDVFLGNNMVDRVLFSENYIQPGNIYYNSNNTFFDLGNFRMITSCDPEDQGHLSISNSPNLEYVILKNGFNHTTVSCNEGGDIFQNPALNLMINNCPNLSQVCVDQTEQPYFLAWIEQMGLQSQVQVNSSCTSSVLGTETFALAEQFIISPVPAHNILQIHSEDNLEINAVEIYNNLGQIVQKEIGNKQTINVSQLAKGSYYLKIKTDDSSYSKQFLKE